MFECFPNFGTAVVNGVSFDRAGIGCRSQADLSCAFWVLMRPAVFLSLASPLPVPRDSINWIRERISEGRAISPPELKLRLHEKLGPAVNSHEGRHRMTILKEMSGSGLFPVRISVDQDLDIAEFIQTVRGGARRQRTGCWVSGPLFEDCETDLGAVVVFGVPPPIWGFVRN